MDTVALFPGVYREVRIGFALHDNGEPLWSVDIVTHIDGVTVVGNGPTLETAASDAASKVRAHIEEAA